MKTTRRTPPLPPASRRRNPIAVHTWLLAGALLLPAGAYAAGVTIITHGWNPSMFGQPAWMASLRDAIATNFLGGAQNCGTITVTEPSGSLAATCSPWNVDLSTGTNAEILILLDWSAVADHFTGGPSAQAVAAVVIDKLVTSQNGDRPLAELPIHHVVDELAVQPETGRPGLITTDDLFGQSHLLLSPRQEICRLKRSGWLRLGSVDHAPHHHTGRVNI
jgi:hypothetical protein